MANVKCLGSFHGYVFDLDGTIYLGDQLIPGARETMVKLREQGKSVVFLTNKPLETRAAYAEKLTRLGIPTKEEDVINSSLVLCRYLAERSPGATVYCIGEEPLIKKLKQFGLRVLSDPYGRYDEIQYVIASFDRTFDYEKLHHGLQAVKQGAQIVATNGDRTCPTEDGEIPDAAGVIGALEGVTGEKVTMIAGKPSDMMAQTVLQLLGLKAEHCLMVGDRFETDIFMGQQAGMGTALVLTGVTKSAQFPDSSRKPDYVLKSVADIGQALDRL